MYLQTEARECKRDAPRAKSDPRYIACEWPHDTVDQTIDELIDRAPGHIVGERREPETRRFAREMFTVLEREIELREALEGALYFNDVCCAPPLHPDRVEYLVVHEFCERLGLKRSTRFSHAVDESPYQNDLDLERALELGDDLRRAAINNLIDGLIDRAPAHVVGAEREPGIRRFASDMLSANGKIRLPEVLCGADQFNIRVCEPALRETLVDQIVAVEFLRQRKEPLPPRPEKLASSFTKPNIMYQPDKLTEAADEAETAMLLDPEAEPVFAYGGGYAVVRQTRPVTALGMANSAEHAAIIPLGDVALRERLMASAKFFVPKGKSGWAPDKAPHDIVMTLAGRAGGRAPTLTGLLHAPTTYVCKGWPDPTGGGLDVPPYCRVLDRPGYDPETGLFCAFETADFRMLPSFGSHEHDKALKRARESYEYLSRELLGEFEFRDKADESAAVAALVTGLVRPACGIAPAFLAAAPVQASGKTTLIGVIAEIVGGKPPAMNSWPEKEEELEKVLLSVLLAGPQVICFDNLRNGLSIKSAGLAKLLSTGLVQGRILGQSTMAALPASALVLLSGNNIGLEGDMPSRVIEIYLDARTERPDQRTYQRDILVWARDNRADVVAHALTIVKAYLDVGAPETGGKPTRFPEWDRMVRRPIMWAGGADIATKFDRAHDHDPVTEAYREIAHGWRPALGLAPLTAGEIVQKVEGSDFDPKCAGLRNLFRDLLGVHQGRPVGAQALGTKLRTFVNRPVDGLRIVCRHDSHGKQNRWSVEAVGE